MLNEYFLYHNKHLEGIESFRLHDPNLARLKRQPFTYQPPLIEQLPKHAAGIYTLCGGRQVGKTTLTKQWMLHLLQQGVAPDAITFISGELIVDVTALLQQLQAILTDSSNNVINYLIIDEVTYIKNWDRALKFAADAGLLEHTVVLLTGSDSVMIKEARMRLPGRRGQADRVDFYYAPLSFSESCLLKKIFINESALSEFLMTDNDNIEQQKLIDQAFLDYLIHGGYLTAINDLASNRIISSATLAVYSDWIRGDMVRSGKSEIFLKEILQAIIKRYGSQISWNSLVDDLSIDHPQTVIEYCSLLERMDSLFIQQALIEDKRVGAPKKAKKLMFNDPFIFHALRAWLTANKDPFEQQIQARLNDPQLSSALVEACVVSHFKRYYPTYYIKSAGEIDIAYIHDNQFWPVEIKWRQQLRSKDLKQIQKYSNAEVYAKTQHVKAIDHVPVRLLSKALLGIGRN